MMENNIPPYLNTKIETLEKLCAEEKGTISVEELKETVDEVFSTLMAYQRIGRLNKSDLIYIMDRIIKMMHSDNEEETNE